VPITYTENFYTVRNEWPFNLTDTTFYNTTKNYELTITNWKLYTQMFFTNCRPAFIMQL